MSIDARRRQLLLSSGAAIGAALFASNLRAASPDATALRWAPYGRNFVVDALGGPGSDDDSRALTAEEIADIRASGVDLVNITVSGVGSYANDFEQTIRAIAHWDDQIAAHPDVLAKATRSTDFDAAKKTRRFAMIYGFQDATPFGESLDRFDLFHDLGVRIIQLTYNRRNLVGDGCLEPGNAGLSTLGRELVARMNERGMLVDLSHCGQRTTREGIELSKKPVAISHAGCAALADLPRNKRDDELRAMAERGGVVGIYFMPYLTTAGQPMADDVVRHIEHAVEVCGEDHVGLGTDGGISPVHTSAAQQAAFVAEMAERRKRGIAAPGERADAQKFVPDLNTPRRFEQLAWRLSKRGHSDARIEKILGANFARLFRETLPS